MPIIDIELVQAPESPVAPGLAQGLADALGAAFEAQPGKIWVRIHPISAAHYAENGVTAPHPAFVTVLAGAPPSGEPLKERVAQITEIVARLTGRPSDRVHVLFEAAAKGRIAFGGRLVE